jgi:hypothetical protein
VTDRVKAIEAVLVARLDTHTVQERRTNERGICTLDILRVSFILHLALLDWIDNPPPTSGFTLPGKVDILCYQPIL